MYDEMDEKRWVVDEEGAQIVRYIFELRKQGESMNKIAKILKKKKVYIPSVYAAKKGVSKPIAKPPLNEYFWNHGMIQRILTNQSYVGEVVNFKTCSSRVPRHAIREQSFYMFFSFIARVFVSVSKLSTLICLIHKNFQRKLLRICKSTKTLGLWRKFKLYVHSR